MFGLMALAGSSLDIVTRKVVAVWRQRKSLFWWGWGRGRERVEVEHMATCTFFFHRQDPPCIRSVPDTAPRTGVSPVDCPYAAAPTCCCIIMPLPTASTTPVDSLVGAATAAGLVGNVGTG